MIRQKLKIKNLIYLVLLTGMLSLSIFVVVNDAEAVVCTRNVPSVIFSPTNSYLLANGTKVYNVTIVNNDIVGAVGDCAPASDSSTFTVEVDSQTLIPVLNTSFTTGVTAVGTDCNAANLSPGQRCNTTLTVTTPLTITDGDKLRVVVKAVDSTNHDSKTGRGSVITKASAFKGDGNLLKRAKEETCHGCHKTDRNRTPSDADWDDAIKSHNSTSFSSGKWPPGGWGVAGGKYGEFVCTTCHTGHSTTNIYLIKGTITTPDGSNFVGSGTSSVTVDFRVKGSGTGNMGDDSGSCNQICEVCHTYAATQPTGVNKHACNSPAGTHYNAQDCTGCHSHKMAFKNSCDACHNSPPTTGKHAIHFGTASVAYGTTAIQSTPSSYGFSCGICHNGTHLSTPSNPRDVEVSFTGVATQDLESGTPTYVQGSTFIDNPHPESGYTFNYSDGTCSNIYCHGNYPGSGLNAFPTFNGTASCSSCHGASNTYPNHPNSGSHERHVTVICWPTTTYFTQSREYACTLCHKDIVSGTGPYTISNKAKHVSGYVDWKFDTTDSRVSSSSTYNSIASGTAVPSDGILPNREYGTCNNVYCHSIVQTTTGGPLTGAEGEYIPPTWGSPSTTCNCHDDGGHISTNLLTSGSHARHLTDYKFNITNGAAIKCTLCHKWVSAASFNQCDQCHVTTEEKNLHVNGIVNVLFDAEYGSSATYNDPSGIPGNGYFNCSNIYCHSQGTSLTGPFNPNISPYTWGSSLDATCTGCHNGYAGAANRMSTGSHTQHINNSSIIGSNYTCQMCHNATVTGNTTISSYSKHVNKEVNASFTALNPSGSYSGSTTPGDAYGNCSSVYCHSNGKVDGTVGAYTTPAWDGVDIGCNGCHGTSTAAGTPDYANGGVGSDGANSHTKHTGAGTSTCTYCHSTTTTTGTTITGSVHINNTRDVLQGGTKTFAYTQGTQTCSTISCHGGGTAQWGATGLSCTSCHLGAGDVDDTVYDNGTTARIDSTEWTTYGHGQTGAVLPLTCDYCHDGGGVSHGVSTNPFRLANNDALGNGLNDACNVCHKTGQSGYNPGAGLKTATTKVNKYHYGSNHDGTRNGGQFCWDCHDPHGDGSNIKMIQSKPAKKSSAYGVPTQWPTSSVVFTNNTIATGADGFAMTSGTYENGICNTCHTYSASAPTVVHYTSTSSDSHNSAMVCTQCHKHSSDTSYNGEAFKGGGCNGCHSYDTVAGSWGTSPKSIEGFGAHAKHIDHIKARFSITLNPTADTFGTGAAAQVCGTCHTNASVEHSTGGGGTRSINFGDATYKEGGAGGFSFVFGVSNPLYNGTSGVPSATDPKTCSNISCHFKETPAWSAY